MSLLLILIATSQSAESTNPCNRCPYMSQYNMAKIFNGIWYLHYEYNNNTERNDRLSAIEGLRCGLVECLKKNDKRQCVKYRYSGISKNNNNEMVEWKFQYSGQQWPKDIELFHLNNDTTKYHQMMVWSTDYVSYMMFAICDNADRDGVHRIRVRFATRHTLAKGSRVMIKLKWKLLEVMRKCKLPLEYVEKLKLVSQGCYVRINPTLPDYS